MRRKLEIELDGRNYDENEEPYYTPFCNHSKQLAKLMRVHGFWLEDLEEIKKLGYTFDLLIKQDKGHTRTLYFMGAKND